MLDDPDLFERVMECPASEREALVRELCGDDEERAEYLLELVRAASLSDDAPDEPPRLSKGDMYGRYCVVSLLGEGSFGQVYDALDLELGRRVALKLLHPDRSRSEVDERRFRREAKALARIDHANVVRVYDAGIEEGRRFLSMELVQGPSLRTWMVTAAQLRWSEVLDRLLPAAKGLAAAHAAGIVHRDFKPENVLVDEARDRVVVVDFGIARGNEATDATHEHPVEMSLTFQTYSAIGTPGYMAPEQGCGDAEPRSDQFAFCRTMLEALGCPIRRSFLQTSSVTEDPIVTFPRPPGVPSVLWRVLLRGSAADPMERYPDMDALVDALQAVRRRRRWAWAGVAATLLLAPVSYAATRPEPSPCRVWDAEVTVASLAPGWASSDPSGPSEALFRQQVGTSVQRWASARSDSCRQHASGVVDQATAQARDQCFGRWLGRLSRALRWSAEDPDVLDTVRFADTLPEQPERCAYVGPDDVVDGVLEPGVRAAFDADLDAAERAWLSGDYTSSRVAADRVLTRAREAGHEAYAADALLQLGTLAARSGAHVRASDILVEALELAQRQRRETLVYAIEARLAETWLLGHNTPPERAIPLLALARAQLARLGERPYLQAELMVLEGHLAQRTGAYDDAKQAYLSAARRYDDLSGGEMDAASSRDHVAEIFSVSGDHADAVALVGDAFEARVATLGSAEHPQLVGVRLRAAAVYLRAGQASDDAVERERLRAEGRAHADAALEQARRIHGNRSNAAARAMTLRAGFELLAQKNRPDVAHQTADLVDVIEALDDDALSPAHRIEGLQTARNLYHRLGRWDGALRATTLLVAAHERWRTPPDDHARDDDLALVYYLFVEGQTDSARTRLNRHDVIYRSDLSTDSDYLALLKRLHDNIDAQGSSQ